MDVVKLLNKAIKKRGVTFGATFLGHMEMGECGNKSVI